MIVAHTLFDINYFLQDLFRLEHHQRLSHKITYTQNLAQKIDLLGLVHHLRGFWYSKYL